jgi:PilZ domain
MTPERRQSRRYLVNGERRNARLRLPGQSVDVTLVDESAGGFAINTTDILGVKVGQVVLLRTMGGWTQSRVVRIRPEADGTHMGLERIRDLGILSDAEDELELQHQLAENSSRGARFLMLAIVLMVAAAGSPTAWRYLYAEQEPSERPKLAWKPWGVANSAPQQAKGATPSQTASAHGRSDSQHVSTAGRPRVPGSKSLAQLVDELLGPFQPNAAASRAWRDLELAVDRVRGRMQSAADPRVDASSISADPYRGLSIPTDLTAFLRQHGGTEHQERLESIHELNRLGEALALTPPQRSRIGEVVSGLDEGLASLVSVLTAPNASRVVSIVGQMLDDAEAALYRILSPDQWSLWQGFETEPTAEPTEPTEPASAK